MSDVKEIKAKEGRDEGMGSRIKNEKTLGGD